MSSGSSVSGSGTMSGATSGSTAGASGSDQQIERAVQAYRACLQR
jgi:hypothetical protein